MMQRDDLDSILHRAEKLNSSAIVDEGDAVMAARYLAAARKVYVPNGDAQQAQMAGELVILLDRIPSALERDPSLLPQSTF